MDSITILVQAGLVFVHPHNPALKFQVKPNARPQQAPFWVQHTETYKAAHIQGLVYAINYVAPPPETKEVKEDKNPFKVGFEPQQAMSVQSLMASGMSFEEANSALVDMNLKQTIGRPVSVPADLDPPPMGVFTPEAPKPKKGRQAPTNLTISGTPVTPLGI